MAIDVRAVAELSIDETATYLGINRVTVTRFWNDAYTSRDRQLRAMRYGSVWRIKPRDLAAFLTANTVTPEGLDRAVVTVADIPDLHNLEQVAAKTGLPLWWLKRGCQTRKLPHIRAGRARLMTPAHICQAIEIATVAGNGDDELAADRLAYTSGRRSSRTPRRKAA